MKLLLTIAFMALVAGAGAQELQMDSTTKKWIYRGVIAVDSMSADDLYARAKEWAAATYKMPDDNIVEIKESGRVVVAGNWLKIEQLKDSDVMRHTLALEVKDGRLRYTFTDFVIDHKNGFMAGSLEYMENTAIKKHRKEYAKKSAAAAVDLERMITSHKSADW
jgi:hypothetical protein